MRVLLAVKKTITFAVFPCVLFINTHTSAQLAPPLKFESIGITDGLSQGFVSDITQDKNGFIWITTSDGLNRYDGTKITTYHHDPEDSTSIGGNDLSCIFEDSKGRLWIGTRNHGIDLFDRETETAKHFRKGDNNSIRSDEINKITEDKSGALWIETKGGLDRLVFEKNGNHIFTHIRLDNDFEQHRGAFWAEKVFVDSKNRVLVTTHTHIWELQFSRDGKNYTLVSRFRFGTRATFPIPEILEDTVRHILYVNDHQSLRFLKYNFSDPQPAFGTIRELPGWTIDKQGRIWTNDRRQVKLIDPETCTERYVYSSYPSQMKILEIATAFYTDRTGIVWIASGGYGLLKYDPYSEQFHHVLPETSIYQILEVNRETLLTHQLQTVRLEKGNLYLGGKIAGIREIEKQNMTALSVSPLASDSSGNIWIGMSGSIYRHDVKTGKGKKYSVPYDDIESTPFPLYTDRDNKLWMGYRNYLVRFDPVSREFSRFAYPSIQFMLDFDFLQCIYEDDHLLWLGTIKGLYRFDTKTEKMNRHYTNQKGNSRSLSNDFVIALTRDMQYPDRYLWIGTKGGGLNRLDKKSGLFVKFSTKNGLPNNVIYGILPDDNGKLWLSSNNGLTEFDPVSGNIRNFNEEDGLQGNEFNRYSYLKTSAGKFVFGGLNGLNYFDPKEIKPLPPPNVMFTDFRLFNKPVDFTRPGSPIRKNISYVKAITLRYTQNVVTFGFAGMDFRAKKGIVYRYKMQGFDKDWIYAEKENEATYTNLDPGKYTFVVQGKFKNGSWGVKTASILLVIVPPWYRTYWFYILVTVSILSSSYAFYKYRINQIMRLEGLRNRIARDLHDEIGSSISTIAIYSKIVHEQVGSKTFNNEPLLKKITEHATEIMESMNDIVWNINTKNDSFDNIIIKMREHAYQLFEAKGYMLHFQFDEALSKIKLQMERRRDFYLIYKEALNNIAKYAEGKNVWITVTTGNQQIHLVIEDDGKGFDPVAAAKSGNGLNNMQFRANALKGTLMITSEIGKGTKLRFVF
ncbi:hypothetical protein FEM33_14045 [Dyadobacter flavalbus]|uniref:Histidine kinase domain-containing protein n=1 Tax=Dyadobacter flavalbus TaxID=2579942 RepID=A0A5M8QVP2_9BACT|nr:hypothetical protein FEM33_14045 [Dyadobacter flavalbus]